MIFLCEVVVAGHRCEGHELVFYNCFLFVSTLLYRSAHSSVKYPCLSLQAELDELVKKEHAKIDSQDKKEKASDSKGAAAKASAASVAPEPKKEE